MYKFFRSSVTTLLAALVLALVLIAVIFVGTPSTSGAAAYASNTNLNNTETAIPSAESVYQSESMKLPPSVGSFIILIANEAHESWQDEKHKFLKVCLATYQSKPWLSHLWTFCHKVSRIYNKVIESKDKAHEELDTQLLLRL